MRSNYFKTALSILILFTTSSGILKREGNFSGTWIINYDKSQSNGAPVFTASKQIKINLIHDSMAIERTNIADDSTTYIVDEKLPIDEKEISYNYTGNRKKTATLRWSNGAISAAYTYSLPNNATEIEYTAIETWSLSEDEKILIVDRTTKTKQGTYSVTRCMIKKYDHRCSSYISTKTSQNSLYIKQIHLIIPFMLNRLHNLIIFAAIIIVVVIIIPVLYGGGTSI